jgi:predicted lipoprotein with Yx(FWY)xxD motif
MRPTQFLTIAVLAVTGCASAAAADAAQGSPPAQSSRVVKIELRRTSIGKILVDSSGDTLYRFTKDPRNKDTCQKVAECLDNWPALRTSARPVAGPGVKGSLLSTIRLSDGAKQVTYAGHPLYLYSSSSEAGETAYVGAEQFGGIWYAVNVAGSTVK